MDRLNIYQFRRWRRSSPRDLLVEADALVSSETSRASVADGADPLDTDALTDLDARVLGTGAHLDDGADALVASDLSSRAPEKGSACGLAKNRSRCRGSPPDPPVSEQARSSTSWS